MKPLLQALAASSLFGSVAGNAQTTPAKPATASPQPTMTTTKPATATPASGGGPGQVWVNTASKICPCPGTQYYGTTKKGEFMTEAAAKAAGNHADHGKACAS